MGGPWREAPSWVLARTTDPLQSINDGVCATDRILAGVVLVLMKSCAKKKEMTMSEMTSLVKASKVTHGPSWRAGEWISRSRDD